MRRHITLEIKFSLTTHFLSLQFKENFCTFTQRLGGSDDAWCSFSSGHKQVSVLTRQLGC